MAGYERVLGLTERTLLDALDAALDQMGGSGRGPRPQVSAELARARSSAEGDSDRSPPAIAPADSPVGRHQKRRRMLLAVLGGILALIGGSVLWIVLNTSNESSQPPGLAANYPDGSDPQVTGCRDDAVILDEVDVYDPPVHLVGTLELRASARCGMNWGRFTPTVGLGQSPPLTLLIETHRPADDKRAPFQVTYDGQAAYGDMLMSRLECAYTTVTLEREGRRSPTFQTACLEAPAQR